MESRFRFGIKKNSSWPTRLPAARPPSVRSMHSTLQLIGNA